MRPVARSTRTTQAPSDCSPTPVSPGSIFFFRNGNRKILLYADTIPLPHCKKLAKQPVIKLILDFLRFNLRIGQQPPVVNAVSLAPCQEKSNQNAVFWGYPEIQISPWEGGTCGANTT
jgi:hypothetical protein